MSKNINRKVVAALLSLVLIVGLFGVVDINAYAEEEFLSDGLLQPEVIYEEISEEEYNEILESEASNCTGRDIVRSFKGTDDNYWSRFSTAHYNYTNSLTSAQKTFYNKLYNALYGMIDGGSDCTPIYKDNVLQCNAGTPEVSYSGLTESQAKDVVYLIMYGRPELYFLDSIIQISYTNSNTGSVRIGVYDDFATCASRSIAASRIRSRIDWYLNQVNDSASAYDKEKKIHDLLIAYCTYGNESSTPYSQSCASVFLNNYGETVCAGYSEAFCMLCYAKGIPAYSVTSSAHEWSQVRLGSYWYAVDVTWDDSSSSNRHFNKSDATMLRLGRNDHTIEALWSRVGRDACLYDYGNEPGAETVDVASDYTGMAYSNLGNWRYVENGFINYSYTGMANNVWGWWYFTNGNLNWTYTGEASNIFGTWYYENGRINWDYYGIAYTGSHWRMVNGGLIDTGYTGMASNIFGWWYFVNGDIDFNYTGMAWNIFGWWYYNNGQLDWTYTGEASNVYGTWYYENGRINWDYYGIAYTGSHWRMVNGGLIDTGYTGMASNIFGWWYFVNGNIDFNYTGMAYNVFGWWYYTNGQLNWTYTGIGENVFGKWLYINGRIPFDYNGNYNINGVNYMIQGGYVV